VNFLIDAQLPARLARALAAAGHDAIHTSDLPDGNRSTDSDIAWRADAENRVVVTKDRDFRDGHLLAGSPRRLLVVATGNITNSALMTLFAANLDILIAAFDDADFLELGPAAFVVHRRNPNKPE
jgi:predicted nuclease of predicted toxin-antitoxin system